MFFGGQLGGSSGGSSPGAGFAASSAWDTHVQRALALHSRPARCFARRHATRAAGVGLDHARVDGEAFAADEPFLHAATKHRLEQVAKGVALPEATVSILREGRVVWNALLEIEPARRSILLRRAPNCGGGCCSLVPLAVRQGLERRASTRTGKRARAGHVASLIRMNN